MNSQTIILNNIPVEVIHSYIFPYLLNELNGDMRLFAKKYTLVSKDWHDMIMSNNFINILLSMRKITRPICFDILKPKDRFRWTIKTIYHHIATINQEIMPSITSEYDLLKSNAIYIIGNIEKIYYKHSENGKLLIYRNLANNIFPVDKKISIHIKPPYNHDNNNWNMEFEVSTKSYINGCYLHDLKTHNALSSHKMISEYNFEIIGDCKIETKELWTHLIYPRIYGL